MTLKTRLSKLETTASPDAKLNPWHQVIGDSKEECEAKRRALIDAGDALETDNFIFVTIVSPKDSTCAT